MVNYLDAQIQKNINENLSLTSGYTFNLQRGSDTNVFGNHIFLNNSLYSQVNFNKNRLNASMGGRYEHFIGSGETLSKPIFRGGINYRFGQATFFRASYGEGIRFPSMLERYVNYETGPMTIFPNEDLKPETGWSGEFGIKQGIKIGEWKGFVDLAAFKMSYEDMMEFSFGKWGDIDDGQLGGFGFKSVNIGNTYIEGLELSIAGEGNIGKTKIQILGGYTYTNPQIDDINYVYDEYLKGYDEDSIPEYNPISYLTTSSDTSGVLKYRYRHLFKFDINLERNRFSSGLSMRFNSQMENIDKAFIEPLFNIYLGTATAWENLNRDLMLLDFRLGYDITEDTRILLNVDNVFNSEQSLRPASLSAPRTYSVLLRMIF
jgi:iron complex outermembrane receptor protein